mmetsp:Transcript_7322/g.19803  ORF Transcript_7322/g.19803 Transcript_7322/m.19803 type:complete len:202 (-) Transcript_7322:350-955(-)
MRLVWYGFTRVLIGIVRGAMLPPDTLFARSTPELGCSEQNRRTARVQEAPLERGESGLFRTLVRNTTEHLGRRIRAHIEHHVQLSLRLQDVVAVAQTSLLRVLADERREVALQSAQADVFVLRDVAVVLAVDLDGADDVVSASVQVHCGVPRAGWRGCCCLCVRAAVVAVVVLACGVTVFDDNWCERDALLGNGSSQLLGW